MDRPIWIDRLLSDTHALYDFKEYVRQRNLLALNDMQRVLLEDERAALAKKGEADVWFSLLQQINTYEREEKDYAVIQEQSNRR